MKKSLQIAFVVVVLASFAPIAQASSPSNPWPVPVPNSVTRAVSAPTNHWPVPVPQSLSSLIVALLSALGL